MASVKVLLAGECDGQLEQLYKRIQTVNAKSGPFKALFCVGRLFSAGELAACAGGGGRWHSHGCWPSGGSRSALAA